MPLDLNDTIAALASPPGPAVRGLIRISGEDVRDVLRSVFQADQPDPSAWATARRPTRYEGLLQLPALGWPLPAALLFWPGRRSFTGQMMAELHLVGAPPLLDAVLERLFECGARPARRGEFTMRAFLAGRLDLLQAEAVLGVIDATDHAELQQALHQLGGGITARLRSVRADLIAVLGDLEAGLDFVEEDIEFITRPEITRRLKVSLETLQQLLQTAQTRLPSGWRRRTVLAGLPNAGKSTLFNRLTGQQRAIVSPIPGTTRDYLSCPLTLRAAGREVEVELIDTAGWEDAADLIMQRAQQLRGEQLQASDLVVWCRSTQLSAADRMLDQQLQSQLRASGVRTLIVETQCDIVRSAETADGDLTHPVSGGAEEAAAAACDVQISAQTGQGLAELQLHLVQALLSATSTRGELLSSTAARCRDSLQRATAALQSAIDAAGGSAGDELLALDLRQSLRQIGIILGDVYTDDILDHIFSRFCIGK